MVSGMELLDRPHSHWGSPCKSTHEQSPNPGRGTLGLFCRYPGQLLQSQVSAGNPGVAGSQREVKSQKAPGHRSTGHRPLYLSSSSSSVPFPRSQTGQEATQVQDRIQELLAPLPTCESLDLTAHTVLVRAGRHLPAASGGPVAARWPAGDWLCRMNWPAAPETGSFLPQGAAVSGLYSSG